jgi:hypothetical protein
MRKRDARTRKNMFRGIASTRGMTEHMKQNWMSRGLKEATMGVVPSTGKYLQNGLTFRMMNSLNVSSRWLLRQNMVSPLMTLKRRKG